ncbi:hypothetical protein [Muribaculum intestinale]|uniref:hypothetical protein n=1 Tax=Muribaculum intestinale TaxID=1796646 RepID=UPI003F675764
MAQTGDPLSASPRTSRTLSVLSGPSQLAALRFGRCYGVVMITTKKGGKPDTVHHLQHTHSRLWPYAEFQTSFGPFETGSYLSGCSRLASEGLHSTRRLLSRPDSTHQLGCPHNRHRRNQTYLSIGTTNAEAFVHNNTTRATTHRCANTTKMANTS